MPAIAYRMLLVGELSSEPAQIGPPPAWWDPGELFCAYGGRSVELPGLAYEDRGILLSAVEAMEWNRTFWERVAQTPRGSDPSRVAELERVSAALRNARWVILEACEWESGLD